MATFHFDFDGPQDPQPVSDPQGSFDPPAMTPGWTVTTPLAGGVATTGGAGVQPAPAKTPSASSLPWFPATPQQIAGASQINATPIILNCCVGIVEITHNGLGFVIRVDGQEMQNLSKATLTLEPGCPPVLHMERTVNIP